MSAMRQNGFGMKANLEKQARKNQTCGKTNKTIKNMCRFHTSKNYHYHGKPQYFGTCQNCMDGTGNHVSNVSCSVQIKKGDKEIGVHSHCTHGSMLNSTPNLSKSLKKEIQSNPSPVKDENLTYNFRKHVDDSLRFYDPKEVIKDTETLDAYFDLIKKKLSGRKSYGSHMKEILDIIKESIPEKHREAIDRGFADAMEYRNQRLKEILMDLDNKFYLMMAEEILKDDEKPLSLALGRKTRRELKLITYLSSYIAEQEAKNGNLRGIYTKTREKLLEYIHLLNGLVQLDLDA